MRNIKFKDSFILDSLMNYNVEIEGITRVPLSLESERNTPNNDGVLTVDSESKEVIIKYNNKNLTLSLENNKVIFKEREV